MELSVVQLVLGLISAFLYTHSGPETFNEESNGIVNRTRTITIGGVTYVAVTASSKNTPVALNWADANQFCKDEYGESARLVNVYHEKTFLILQDLLGIDYPEGTNMKFWVDGLYNGSQFIWREKGIPVDQPWTQWGNGEPKKPFTLSRRVMWHQVSRTRAEFQTDDAANSHEMICQHSEPKE